MISRTCLSIVAVAVMVSTVGAVDAVDTQLPPSPPPEEFELGDETFYDVPDSMTTGEHGDLVRYQMIDFPIDGVTMHRIMYLSETVSGDPTVITGVVTVGSGEAPEGGWQLLVHGHGSVGLADECAPSVSLGGDGMNALEIGLLASLAPTRGFAVVSTDYEGLGGPGVHPFLVGVSEGRSMLDAGLAARQLPDIDLGDVTAIAGYSQGGHAALFAHQLAQTWTPGMAILGTVAGAPATEISDSMRGDDRSISILAGLAASSPDAAAAVDEILTPAGRQILGLFDESCFLEGTSPPPPPYLHSDPTSVEPLASMIASNEPGDVAAAAPILIIHSAVDETVPIEGSAAVLERQCAAGQVVERRVLPDGAHVPAAVPAYNDGLVWLAGLADGATPISSCASG